MSKSAAFEPVSLSNGSNKNPSIIFKSPDKVDGKIVDGIDQAISSESGTKSDLNQFPRSKMREIDGKRERKKTN